MKTLIWTYRPERISSPYSLDGNVSMNGTYTCGFFLSNQFGDWTAAGLTSIKDSLLSEEQYTWELVPWVKKLTRLVVCEYNETYVDPAELTRSLTNVGARFNLEVFADSLTAKEWIRANTSLVERSEGVFVIREESVGIMGETIEEQLLIV